MKKKAFLFLLLIPFIVAILAFVTATFVIREVETNITGISWNYKANTPFMLKSGASKLEAKAIYDENLPLSEGNDLVWTSSDPEIASIEVRSDGVYLIPRKEGEVTITCSNEKGTVSQSFTAIIVGEGGAIILNPIIPFSSSKISSTNYVGLYDSKEAYDLKGENYSNSDAYLALDVELVGAESFTLDAVTVNTSSNITYDKVTKRIHFLDEGKATIDFINPYSEVGSAHYEFTLVDAVNAYDYDDLISLTNKANKPYKIVMRVNLDSLANSYNLDEGGKALTLKREDTKLFGRLDEKGYVKDFKDDLYEFETTYNHDFLDKWNNEVKSGHIEDGELTKTTVYSGIHIQDDFYGNGFLINAHELTYPSDSQTISVDGTTITVPYLTPSDLYRGPLAFVTLGDPNYSTSNVYPMYTLYGQDNSAFYVDGDDINLVDVHFRGCDFGNNLSNLEYVGTTLEISGDNVSVSDSIIENGRNVIRAYSSLNLTLDNSLVQNAMEFLFKSGSNEFNKVDYSEKANYHAQNDRVYTSDKATYLAPITNMNYSEKTYKADSMLTATALLNTQGAEFLNFVCADYSKEEMIRFKEDLINVLTNKKGIINEDDSKVYKGTTKINDTYFSTSGISAISLDSLPQGTFLENNTTSVFGLLLMQYMQGASPANLALTGYPTKVEVSGDTRFYDWKSKDLLTFESLVGQDIKSLIVAHGGLGDGFDISIIEDDYLPLKKLLLDNHSSEILKDEKLNLPVYFQGGGYNKSDIIFSDNLKEKMSETFELDPFIYSLDLKAIHSDHFMSDPQAKYETMKVAMLRASSNVLGFNEYKIIAIKNSDGSWFNEYPSLNDLIARS